MQEAFCAAGMIAIFLEVWYTFTVDCDLQTEGSMIV